MSKEIEGQMAQMKLDKDDEEDDEGLIFTSEMANMGRKERGEKEDEGMEEDGSSAEEVSDFED
eukprot:CAMPEP_0202979868 /NCGR_PEP_ID=MMETSP1396-20130829/85906_1 /ASSEMBLY_ACC=CAM_ASM_000872 /TAXON_ID= /ORGANISM="Pseudokeronopsis sp., Strain Brazil" /LENGTH=62 /DNA_ID=CAMNT_0049719501 /DNA_START=87 /DNA_END=275 /DNA_ORIENTATION=+